MAKYSFEFKKRIVTEYLNGEGGYTYLTQKHDIPSDEKEKKLSVVELYLSNEISYRDYQMKAYSHRLKEDPFHFSQR